MPARTARDESTIRSGSASVNIPSTATLDALLGDLLAPGDRVALAQIGQRGHVELTYRELDRDSTALAAGLRTHGLARGDRVILLAPNSPDWLIACVALLRSGVVPVPVDSQMAASDLEHVASDCEAKWICTTQAGIERIRGLDAFADVRTLLLDDVDSAQHWRNFRADTSDLTAGCESEDIAVIFYTSGTSGAPKGVPLTHRNIVSNVAALLSLKLVDGSDRVLLPLPLHHVYPFVIGVLTPLLTGMTIIVPSSLVGQHFFAALRQGSPSILLGVPRLYDAICGAIEQQFRSRGKVVAAVFNALLAFSAMLTTRFGIDIGRVLFVPIRRSVGPRLRLLISGGSAMDARVATTLAALGFRLAAGYGLTETSPILCFRSAEMRGANHVGRPLPGVEVRIAAPEERLEHGEVQAKGPNVFAGYLNLPDKTADAFTDDGWFRTGDLGAFDKRGFLRLSGRMSSMIVMPGGENVDPEKIEQALEQSPAVKEAGIVLLDGRLGCLVVPAAEFVRDISSDELDQAMRRAVTEAARDLASYQRPGDVRVEKTPLPRTRLGKLRRVELAARFSARGATDERAQAVPGLTPRSELAPLDRELLEDSTAGRVWAWLGERFASKAISPDTHMQLDLDVDSLAWLNLTLEIRNEVGIDLTDDAVARIELVRDLLQEATGSQRAEQLSADVLGLLREPESLVSDEDRQAWLAPRGGIYRLIDAIALGTTRLLMRLVFRLDLRGSSNLPAEGPFVISANHLSSLDPLVIMSALDRSQFRATYWGGWVGILFKNRISRAFSHAMRILPVEPRAGPISNLALAAAVLQQGRILVWFPEGERSASGETLRFRPGVSLLLQASGARVVPAWIEGAGHALPPGRLLPRPMPLAVRFGTPIDAEQLEQEGAGETAEERVADALRARVCALAES